MVARRNPVVPRRTVHVGGCPVQTTVTARPAVVRRWLYTTLWLNRRRLYSAPGGLTVGLGVQWRTPFRKLPAGVEPRPGTLQLCVGNRCLVLQLARLDGGGAVPQILRRFLADARVTFAGYYIASDCRKLRAHHGLEVESTLELCGAGGGTRRASMADMAERLLGIRHGVEKSMKLSRSRWDGAKLSREPPPTPTSRAASAPPCTWQIRMMSRRPGILTTTCRSTSSSAVGVGSSDSWKE